MVLPSTVAPGRSLGWSPAGVGRRGGVSGVGFAPANPRFLGEAKVGLGRLAAVPSELLIALLVGVVGLGAALLAALGKVTRLADRQTEQLARRAIAQAIVCRQSSGRLARIGLAISPRRSSLIPFHRALVPADRPEDGRRAPLQGSGGGYRADL